MEFIYGQHHFLCVFPINANRICIYIHLKERPFQTAGIERKGSVNVLKSLKSDKKRLE